MKQFLKILSSETFIIIILLVISTAAHGYNMFHYPYYENDEGTYMSQAWSLLKQGNLAPYTYWYDHAPLGWMLIALWVKLTGGYFTFGLSVDSGRMLMLVLHVASTYFLFYIAKRLSGSLLTACLAVLFFSLSPLGIYYQRRVLLDNIMIFWVLASMALLLRKYINLRIICLSAVLFGFGVLSKENAIFFAPGYIYLLYSRSSAKNKMFTLTGWTAVSLCIISLYPLYALLKNELLPAGKASQPHVSLLGTINEQIVRGSSFPFWNTQSEFYLNLIEWIRKDPYVITIGFLCFGILCIGSLLNKKYRVVVLFTFLYILFLIRGKLVIDFYIVPLIPFLSLCVGLSASLFPKKNIMTIIFIMIMTVTYLRQPGFLKQFARNETEPQKKVVEWIKKNVDPSSHIVIDDYAYVDLHEKKLPTDRIFPNADWVWKVELDRDIKNKKLHGDWRNIDYILLTHETVKQIKNDEFPLTKLALAHSDVAADWSTNTTSHINLSSYISTNGDWARVYKTRDRVSIQLAIAWDYYKSEFLTSYGQVVDHSKEDITTSENQAIAMLRSVWHNDKKTFDGIALWTADHLQYRKDDKLFSSTWGKLQNGQQGLKDASTTTSADQDIALALVVAYLKWGEDTYGLEALAIMNDIWNKEIVRVDGVYYPRISADSEKNGYYTVVSSSLSPATYRMFALLDKDHPWERVAEDMYVILDKIVQTTDFETDRTPLIPNMFLLDKNTGDIISGRNNYGIDSDFYGNESAKLIWYLLLDAKWFNNEHAKRYLEDFELWYTDMWRHKSSVSATYDLEGNEVVPYGSMRANMAFLSAVYGTVSTSKDMYTKLFMDSYHEKGCWDICTDHDDQNWGWLGTLLYNDRMKPY